jgi:hypothetical protein
VMNKERGCEQGVGNSGEDNIPLENVSNRMYTVQVAATYCRRDLCCDEQGKRMWARGGK